MTEPRATAIILAAGKGTRMRSQLHKVLHPVGGLALIHHLRGSLEAVGIERQVLVVGSGREQVEAAVPDVPIAVQEPQLGTGHAVMCARDALDDLSGDVLVLYGDTPFIPPAVLQQMIETRRSGPGDNGSALVVLGFRPADPGKYGRLIMAGDQLERIVEFKDANDEERAVGLCNSGVMVFDGARLGRLLDGMSDDNAAGEYYLTDAVALARAEGWHVGVVEAPEEDLMGVNSRADLAAAEKVFQAKRRAQAMAAGVTLQDPDTVFFAHDTQLAQDVTVGANVVFGPGVKVGSGSTIHPFSHLEGTVVGEGVSVGPFARLRPGAVLDDGSRVGNFVELKKAHLGAGAKANHLSYIGDAVVRAGANIGAGTITCNYDGYDKHKTEIGEGAFIGSNTALVAPVAIGAGAIVGAGSTISRHVEADALALTRADQTAKPGWAKRFREMKKRSK